MATPKFPITQELQNVVETHPNIEQVYFTTDGHHHFRAFRHGNSDYTRLAQVPELSKGGIATGKHVLAPIKNAKGADHEDHLVVDTVDRESILKATPVASKKESLIKKADILSILDISEDELAVLLNKKKK